MVSSTADSKSGARKQYARSIRLSKIPNCKIAKFKKFTKMWGGFFAHLWKNKNTNSIFYSTWQVASGGGGKPERSPPPKSEKLL